MTHVQDRPVAPSAPLAVDTAKIGPTLRRKRVWSALIVVAAMILGVAALCTYVALDNHYLAVQRTLPRYPGVITDVRDTSSEDSSGEVDVRWTQDDERWKTTIHVGNTGSWHDGQSVHVIVDPERPNFATLPGENYKPDGFDLGFGALGLTCAVAFFVMGVRCVRAHRKLRRARESSWRTVEAHFVRSQGEGDKHTLVFLPDVTTQNLWLVKGRIPNPSARVQVAGNRGGLVVRLAEDADLMLAERMLFFGPPATARVSAYDERDRDVAFRLDAGDAMYFLCGPRHRLAPDVVDLAAVRAATIRPSTSEVLVQLGVSEQMSVFNRLTEKQVRRDWPTLIDF